MESTIPLLPCKSLAQTLAFYGALGFEVTHEQTNPYLYGAVQRGEVQLHFASLSVYGAKNAFGASLVFVPSVAPLHKLFADGLRAKYGKVPTAGVPRISRLSKPPTRFKVFDPSGNVLIYISHDEPDADYEWSEAKQSGLASALENAVFLRDTYANDKAAAKTLDVALKRHEDADPLDRALALAARTELAVALGDGEAAQRIRVEVQQLPLTDEQRTRYHDELHAADALELWIG